MIEVRDISKSFGAVKAVSSVSCSIGRGEIFGVVGPDGAGKSTLLRMLSTILRGDGGSITVGGENAAAEGSGIKERIAYMPQRFGLYEDLTVEENIFFFGRLFAVPRRTIEKEIVRLYEFSRLGPFRDRLAGNLSGGMKQKLGLACCLVHTPEVLLLDEPTNGVDPVSRREFWKILYDLLADGVTIVVSTAYLDEAERCNRIAFMYNGRFITTGSPAEIKAGVGKRFLEIRTDNAIRAEMELRKHGEYRGVILTGATLKLFVDSAAAAGRDIRRILSRSGIRVLSLAERRPSLEDCFVHIVAGES
ncbi:MAG TPA: ABC transporter ATP-binding protein [Spirochaetota bacterium]|nr:ABC transporter ATP-binding protein [Spirochaetota bacterium]